MEFRFRSKMAEGTQLVPRTFFKKIVCEYDSKMHIWHPIIIQRFDSSLQAVEFFKNHPEYFVVFEDDEGNPQFVVARIKDMALCIPYATYRKGYNCLDPQCPRIHLCREYVSGYCRNGMNCDRSHTFNTNPNRMALKKLNLLDTDPPYPEDKLLEMLRVCSPQVCGWYNHLPHCRNGTGCYRFHICKEFVTNRCVTPACHKAHDLNSRHSQRLLKAYNLEGKTLLEVKDMLLIHKVMPKDDQDRANQQFARHLHMLRRLAETRDDKNLQEKTLTAKDTQKKLKPDKLFHEQEIEEIQNALEEVDLSEFLAYQQIVDSQEVFTEIRQTTKTHGKGTDQDYLCGSFVNGQCDDARCPDVHFPTCFLWQVQVDGLWYNLHNINDDLEQAYNRRDREFLTQIPSDAHTEAGQPLVIGFNKMPKGVILHNKTKVKVRRLQVRPQSSQSERATQQAISWQILKDDTWLTLEKGGEEIEKAFQNKENEYITELPTSDNEVELIAINFESNTAESLVTTRSYNIKRIVRDGLMEKKETHEQERQAQEPQADNVGAVVCTGSEEDEYDEEKANPQKWQWQWRNEELKWVPFHELVSHKLEEQYLKGKDTCRFRVDEEEWLIDYLALTQTITANRKEYHIRRVNKI